MGIGSLDTGGAAMTMVSKDKGTLRLNAYVGDAKTLLAFKLAKGSRKNLEGLPVKNQRGNKPPYYLLNELQYEKPSDHAQDPKLPPNSTFNAPIHKFRWLHVPGSAHQGLKPFYGLYTYTVTPRYFDATGSLQAIDPKLGVSLKVDLKPFTKGKLSLGFTRGLVQSPPL